MLRGWPARVLFAGLLLAAVPLACMGYALPGRVAPLDWPLYALLLLCPYLLAALACRLSPTRIVRALAVLIALFGVVLAGVAIFDTWPVIEDGSPPAMPASTLAAAGLIPLQNIIALVSLLIALYSRPVAGRGR